MYHRLWTFLNLLLIFGSMIYIWIFQPHDSSFIIISQFLAQIAIILFFLNVNMYFIFLIIRKSSQRNIKVRLAKFSRYFMKWHIKVAISATILITGHALINLMKIGPLVGYFHMKMITGYTSFIFLCITLFAGYLRHRKSTGFRKKFHRLVAFVFSALFLVHMFLRI